MKTIEQPAAGAVIDHAFRAMGCDVRIVAVAPARDPLELVQAGQRAQQLILAAAARLTRFDAGSELRQLGANPAAQVTVSPLLAHALHIALGAAERSGGLLDPTLVESLEAAGYAQSWNPARRADLPTVVAMSPTSSRARPDPAARWKLVSVDPATHTVRRPPGLQLDLGATAKGLIADLALRTLGAVEAGFIDAGGDLALAGTRGMEILAEDPLRRPSIALQTAGPCGVATSSIANRCWLTPDGPAHHLLDPSTGRAAFTGVIQATAAAPSTAEAERLAGQALLSGPDAGARLLAPFGGLLVLDDATTVRLPGALLQ